MIDPIHRPASDAEPDAGLRDAIESLYFGYREFTRRPDRILEGRGLGRVHHRILYFVGRQPGQPVGALLQILAVSKQAINAPLRLLVAKGLINIGAGEGDRRLKRLTLSRQGMDLEAELTGAQMRHMESAFAAVGAKKAAGWMTVMSALGDREQRLRSPTESPATAGE